jgi:hypothetical protein
MDTRTSTPNQKTDFRAPSTPDASSGNTDCGVVDSSRQLIRIFISFSFATVNDDKGIHTVERDDSILWLDPGVVRAAICLRSP